MPAATPARTGSFFDQFVRIWRMLLAPVGSLKITVVLFVLSGLLVFFGTLAQKGQGVWTVVDSYFYSWFVNVEVKYLVEFAKVFIPGTKADATSTWSFPFPAGKLLGVLMVINLIAAYARNFPGDLNAVFKQSGKRLKAGGPNRWLGVLWEFVQFGLKRAGVYTLHAGILLLFVGEAITREQAVEQQMLIPEGGSSNYAYEVRNFELAFVDRTDPAADKMTVLPAKKMKAAVDLRDHATQHNLPAPSTRFSHDDLPVDVEVVAYYSNSRVREIGPTLENVVKGVLPPKPAGGETNPAREAVMPDVVAVLQAFDAAREKEPKEPPLPLFEKVLAEVSAGKFQGKHGQETLARIQAGVAELKGEQQATTGVGMQYIATSAAEVSGVDTSAKIDLPSAYVNLFDKKTGNSLGIYLVSAALALDGEPAQTIPDQPAVVELRPKRHYKAYTLHLNDFKFDRYVGTDTARNYSSDVRLEDPELSQNREVTIRMNEPLRHRGDAIFQSSFTPDEKATILQVVSNPGWQIPYISCLLVGFGMGFHFCVKMLLFILRSVKGVKSAAATPSGGKGAGIDMTGKALHPFARYGVPAIAAIVATLALLGLGRPSKPTKDRLDLQKLATLPVVDGGRVKPLDSVARVRLRQITHAEEATDGKKKRQAVEWLMDAAVGTPGDPTGPGSWAVFRIENDEVRSLLKLDRREGLRYSVNEMSIRTKTMIDLEPLPKDVLEMLAQRGVRQQYLAPDQMPPDVKDLMDAKGLRPTLKEVPELRPEFKAFMEESKKAFEQRKNDPKALGVYQNKLLELAEHLRTYQEMTQGELPLVIPPSDEKEWQKAADAGEATEAARMDALQKALPRIRERLREAGVPPDLKGLTAEQSADLERIGKEEVEKEMPTWAKNSEAWQKVLSAYRDNDPKAFDAAVADYRKRVAAQVPASAFQRADLETYLNQSGMFYWCTVLYGVAAVASLIGFVLLVLAPKASQTIRRGVFWWLLVVFVAHTFTLLARMYLMDRPLVFVTNLYSSAVFIGWGVMALCLILELVFPIGFGNLVASVLGFATTIIAHNLATTGDTLEMMQAVLDTNFWLATHVTTVTLGYSATYVAGVLGLLYVVLYMLPEKSVLRQRVVIGSGLHQMNYDIGKILGTLTYAVVCFAALLSFVGTVLGGIWADQSWGRFWGWDPKENGAILIVLWNALILHARWGGIVKERGMGVLAVGGIAVTTWSWFGTNQLGVGLHAYGFNNGLVALCDGVWVGTFFAVLFGVLPWQWVYRGGAPAPPPQATRA
jgi:ABC-type transport system involved in cytochrome c biogenesis permease subunit